MGLNGEVTVCLPGTGGRWSLAGKNVKLQCGHNDFNVMKNIPAGYFALVTSLKGSSLSVCISSHKFMVEESEVRKVLCNKWRMHMISFLLNSLLFLYGYMEQDRPDWEGKYCLWYHIYLILETKALEDAIYFAYGNSLWHMKRSQRLMRSLGGKMPNTSSV